MQTTPPLTTTLTWTESAKKPPDDYGTYLITDDGVNIFVASFSLDGYNITGIHGPTWYYDDVVEDGMISTPKYWTTFGGFKYK